MNPLREQLRSMLRVESRENGLRAFLQVDAGLLILPDHFPGRPILPGICMIQAVLLAAAQQQGAENLHLRSMRNAKMMMPVQPGDVVVIDAELIPTPDGNVSIKAKLTCGEKRCAEFSLIAGGPVMEGAPA